MANPSSIAGLNPPGSSGFGPEAFQNTLTPGYTGGIGTQPAPFAIDWTKVDPNVAAPWAILTQFQQNTRSQELDREERLFDKIQAMRKREAQEAYQMQLPFRIGEQVSGIFRNIVQAQQPGLQAELAIRGRTPEILAQTYANNPYAGRKWLA